MGNCMGDQADTLPPTPQPRASRLVNGEMNNNRRVQIFEPAQNQEDIDLSKLLTAKKVDVETKILIQNALSKFFGLENAKTQMKLVISAMERENVIADTEIITQGDPGDKLYIIEKGDMEVTINSIYIRTMIKGDMVGELALLYDAPRGATVRTITDCVVWSLSREHFKSVQAVSTSAVFLQRAKWLIASTDLATLGQIDMSRLISVMQSHKFADGEELYIEGQPCEHIILIESGKAKVVTSEPVDELELAQKDEYLGIVRPRHLRKSVADLDPEQFAEQYNKLNEKSNSEADLGEVDVTFASGEYEVYDGCLMGIGGLRAKAGLPNSGAWKWNKNSATTLAPFSVVALGPVEALVFTRKVFENLFGPNLLKPTRGPGLGPEASGERSLRKFDAGKFKMKYVLGSGSFGVVIYAESREDATSHTHYALKVLSKTDVIVTGQLRHVMDERRLLAQMESPFILKLYGTYQTPHQIVLVTEAINNGDMWAVIYEPPFYNKSGLPPKLILFYSASIVMALSHIHSKGMAYRDLKPENIMIDSKGYIRIIDFGFAKTIPYTKTDETTGESKVYAKSYTLCGTPEYLAPEFVFNLGHDHSADLWALGVMVYEMYMTVTPFAPKRVDNITELFNNIAVTKTNGVKLPSKLEERAKGKIPGDLILTLLKPEPSERKGVQEGYTSVILEHEFFKDLDVEGLVNGTLKPVYIPNPPQSPAPISSLPAIKAFKGDQAQFDFF